MGQKHKRFSLNNLKEALIQYGLIVDKKIKDKVPTTNVAGKVLTSTDVEGVVKWEEGTGSSVGSLEDLGVTSTSTELNILDGAEITTEELNKLHGVNVSTTEINKLSGITTNVQEQLNNMQPKIPNALEAGMVYTSKEDGTGSWSSNRIPSAISDLRDDTDITPINSAVNAQKLKNGSYEATLPTLSENKTIALTTDIPIVDNVLSNNSTNPISNKAVYNAISAVTGGVEYIGYFVDLDDRDSYVGTLNDGNWCTIESDSNHDNNKTKYIYNDATSSWEFNGVVAETQISINDTAVTGTDVTWSVDKISNELENYPKTLADFDVNVSATQINKLDGLTTNVQEQLNNKQSKLPLTDIPNKVLKSTSSEGVVEWGEVETSIQSLTDLGINATANDINKLADITATTNEINKLSGSIVTKDDLDYLHGVTGDVQTQLNGKQVKLPETAIPNKVLKSTSQIGVVEWGEDEHYIPTLEDLDITVDPSEINSLDGVTSNIQTQLNNKQSSLPSVSVGGKVLSSTDVSGAYEWVDPTEGLIETLNDLGITATAEQINTLADYITTVTEINYLHGVTSNVQDQLNSKCSKSVVLNYNLTTDGWVDGEYSLNINDLSNYEGMDITCPYTSMTEAEIEACQNANIIPKSTNGTTLVLKAQEEVPTITLPITIVLRGDL